MGPGINGSREPCAYTRDWLSPITRTKAFCLTQTIRTRVGGKLAIDKSDLSEGREFSKGELEETFRINFGYQINGIVVRKLDRDSERRLILLFQRNDGPYPDLVTKDKIKYVGAGLRGDQSLSGVNRILADRGPVDGVHFFHQLGGSVKWKYLGHGTAHYLGEEHVGGRKLLMYDVQLNRE